MIHIVPNQADVERLGRKLTVDLIGPPVRSAMEAFGEEALRAAQPYAPYAGGTLRDSLERGAAGNRFELDGSTLPAWLEVGTQVVSARGFPYPRVLNEAFKYHYRQGVPARAAGSATARWWSEPWERVKNSALGRLLSVAGREVKAAWERR